ncbi:Hypothetical predicted protein [Cloeon dipterum]|uniref:Uncharacterized protein n=1 Tax=Cloeon dipterum TaxID=197152 RepID=A0A8S1EB63_9INSE|nr:Hypothetical predicted protein [Cloeon dipterum]
MLGANTMFTDYIKKISAIKAIHRKSDENRDDALREAISPDITEVNFATILDLFTENPPYIIDILKTITLKAASNIRDFQIMEGNVVCPSMSKDIIEEIVKMTNLRTLKVRQFSISFSTLVELCGKLPRLKNLYFKIEPEPNFKITDSCSFLKTFGGLEVFQFSSSLKNSEFRESLTLESIRYLPNLKLLGDPDHFVDMLPTCLEFYSSFQSKKSNLTSLMLYVEKDIYWNAFKQFPQVSQLQIRWGRGPNVEMNITGLLDFPDLKKLTLTDLNKVTAIDKFLLQYGNRLTHLTLDLNSTLRFEMQSAFDYVFSRCDKLEQLSLRNLDVKNPMSSRDWSFASGNSLKELELQFSSNSCRNAYIQLSRILSAPNLEKVMMIRVPVSLQELVRTMDLVKKQKILKKVNHFELEVCENKSILTPLGRLAPRNFGLSEYFCGRLNVERIAQHESGHELRWRNLCFRRTKTSASDSLDPLPAPKNIFGNKRTTIQSEEIMAEDAQKLNPDCSFKNVWIPFVDELNVPGRDTNEQKLDAVAKMILKIQTETICFFPIVEFFKGDSKSMVEILKRISGKKEITEFRFLEDDSLKNKKERLNLDWNDFNLSEDLKSDLEGVRVELKKMSNLHTIKIDLKSL